MSRDVLLRKCSNFSFPLYHCRPLCFIHVVVVDLHKFAFIYVCECFVVFSVRHAIVRVLRDVGALSREIGENTPIFTL